MRLAFKQAKAAPQGGKAGHLKQKRTLPRKTPIHLILKSTRATGPWRLLKYSQEIERIIRKAARENFIRVDKIANAGNHLHIVIRVWDRPHYQCFIRAVTGLVARKVTGAERANPLLGRNLRASASHSHSHPHSHSHSGSKIIQSLGRFWTQKPYTRVASAREFKGLMRYLDLNTLESTLELTRFEAHRLLRELSLGRVPVG